MTAARIPRTLAELGEALSGLTADSLVLAGGTDLALHMRSRLLNPDVVLCLGDVAQLREIHITPEQAVIGSMVTMREVQAATHGLADLQALADAAGGVGSPQIRNKGTIGGNVANASPAGDLPPVLWMLHAQVDLMCPGGIRRSVPIEEFLLGSEKTQLTVGEVIVSFTIDRTALKGWRSAFEKLGHRSQVTISRIGLAVALLQDEGGVVQDARVVAGAIQPIPFQLKAAEELLRGHRPDPALATAIGETFQGNTRRVYKAAAAKGVVEDVLMRFQR